MLPKLPNRADRTLTEKAAIPSESVIAQLEFNMILKLLKRSQLKLVSWVANANSHRFYVHSVKTI